ncbi:MAG: hypothetical protein WA775_13520 [Psychroserpens sp.]|uniref:hypothetical protein n=2 Tax=Psychroserpens sp. TaxID=2020870 RepID=UPI003C899997
MNTVVSEEVKSKTIAKIPKNSITNFYDFQGIILKIRYESSIIKSLIHPKIAHQSCGESAHSAVTFDMFKTNSNLHLFKNNNHVGTYATSNYHFLQGQFALELSNSIHNKCINDWIATFHASTVNNGEESIMIVGNSGNGKSTLAALLMANGFDLLSDDFTPLYKDLNLYSYPAAISIKKGAFKALDSYIRNFKDLETKVNSQKNINVKYVAPTSDLNESKAFLPCNKIVLVKYDALKPSKLESIALDKILETLIPESWISPKEDHANLFMTWLKNIECYQLNYSDNTYAIDKFTMLFDQ